MAKCNYDVLITDSSQRVALELTRALGEKGLKVLNIEKESFRGSAISASSRYSSAFKIVPSYSSDEFTDHCRNSSAVFPVSTNTNIAIYERALLEFPDKFLLPAKETFLNANSKSSSMPIASDLGIPCPKSITAKNGPIPIDIINGFTFPIVLKLANDESLMLEPFQRYGIARTMKEAELVWERLKIHGKDILVQEYLSGGGFGWSAVYDSKGSCASEITHMRLREYPISGGPSAFCMSIKDDVVSNYGKKILDYLRWKGPAMVEFKRDSAGKVHFLEINPRYWGSLPLARHAGINMPFIHYQILQGDKYQSDVYAKEKIKLKFRGMDLMAGIQEFKHSSNKIKYAGNFVKDFMNPQIPDGIFSFKDPLPGLIYVMDNILKMF